MKIEELEKIILSQLIAVWQAGNCCKYKPDEVPIESLKGIAGWLIEQIKICTLGQEANR